MVFKRIYILTVFLVLVLCLLGFMYTESTQKLEDIIGENSIMNAKIVESEQKQKEAFIQKRISEQLEEIAQQQKVITESQKTIALEQRSIAEQKQKEAVVQKQLADVAKLRAVNALEEAEMQKTIAVEQKDLAKTAEKNANRLRMLSLGQSLSARSINQHNTGNQELASMLALTAWQFMIENDGDLYQAELFKALKTSSMEDRSFRARFHQTGIRDLGVLPNSSEENMKIITADEGGQLVYWSGDVDQLSATPMWSDPEFSLRKICFNRNGSRLIVSDASGNLLLFNAPYDRPNVLQLKLSGIALGDIVFLSNTKLAITDERTIAVMDVDSRDTSSQTIYNHTHVITQLIFDSKVQKLYFSDERGVLLSLDNKPGAQAEIIAKIGEQISSIMLSNSSKIALGTKSGKVCVINLRSRSKMDLIGHISQVNDLAFINDMLISISYDKTVRLWNLKNETIESIIIEEQNSWGYCLKSLPVTEKVIFAGNDKALNVATINTVDLATMVRKNVKRNFTQDEWNTNVDPSIPLRSFKSDK